MKRITYTDFVQDARVKYLPRGEVVDWIPTDSVPVRIVGNKLEIYKLVVEGYGIYFDLVKEVEL